MQIVIDEYRKGDEGGAVKAQQQASQALEWVEGGLTVSYSDRDRLKMNVSDPEELGRLLGLALRWGRFPIVVEVVEERKARVAGKKYRVDDEQSVLEVLELVEQGKTVMYSDASRAGTEVSDPDTLVSLLKRAWREGQAPVEVEVID